MSTGEIRKLKLNYPCVLDILHNCLNCYVPGPVLVKFVKKKNPSPRKDCNQ